VTGLVPVVLVVPVTGLVPVVLVVPVALVEPVAPVLVLPPAEPLAAPLVVVPPAPQAKAQPRMVAAVTAAIKLRLGFMIFPFYSLDSLFPMEWLSLIIFEYIFTPSLNRLKLIRGLHGQIGRGVHRAFRGLERTRAIQVRGIARTAGAGASGG
jgi:hypothetical protein